MRGRAQRLLHTSRAATGFTRAWDLNRVTSSSSTRTSEWGQRTPETTVEGASKEAGEILPDVVGDGACGHDGFAVAMPPPNLALKSRAPPSQRQRYRRTYAALDLGTNNCRLLVAHP